MRISIFYCPFNRGVRLKEVLVPRPLSRYDLKENNIVFIISGTIYCFLYKDVIVDARLFVS